MLLKSVLLSTALLLAVPAFAQEAAPTPATASAAMTVTDPAQFAAMAGSSNTFEIESSTLAKETSQNQEVIAFADQMIADHTKAAQEMMAAAEADGVTPPADLDEKHQAMMDSLDGLEEAEFDQAYIAAQVQAHDEAVALFESYSTNGPEGALKEFATKTLPTLKMHQEHVHGLAGQ
jgi:putative membrane protein